MRETAAWDWERYPQAERFLQEQVTGFLRHHHPARSVAARIERDSSTCIFDWIDHLTLPLAEVSDDLLREMGYARDGSSSTDQATAFRHPRSMLFPVLLTDDQEYTLSLKSEDLESFSRIHAPGRVIEGQKGVPLRRVEVAREGPYHFQGIERRGFNGFSVFPTDDQEEYARTLDLFLSRRRSGGTVGYRILIDLIADRKDHLAVPRIADAFFRAEMMYWKGRNHAAGVVKGRQDGLGLGFGNHDHLTFRSSREHFHTLIGVLLSLGMKPRERFYAGFNAGWGAQILEHPSCDRVVFADVDLSPEERDLDFIHRDLRDRKELGTVGLWVGLHGESALSAGLHHAALRFSFEQITADLFRQGVPMMKPFSNFPFLKQAFSMGEMWKVEPDRVRTLSENGQLEPTQATRFLREGALGSHLESIQRNEGFKGFNQDSVSAIIRQTDPRKVWVRAA